VNDAGIIVKGVDHLYPNLLSHLEDPEEMNRIMLRRSEFRSAAYDNWGIGQSYSNKEIFGLHLEIRESFTYFPISKPSVSSIPAIYRMFREDTALRDIGNSYYFPAVFSFLETFALAVANSLKSNGILPEDFAFGIHSDEIGNIQIASEYRDELVSKNFIICLADIFSPIASQKYLLSIPMIRYETGKAASERLYMGKLMLGLPDALSKNQAFRKNFRNALVPWENELGNEMEKLMPGLPDGLGKNPEFRRKLRSALVPSEIENGVPNVPNTAKPFGAKMLAAIWDFLFFACCSIITLLVFLTSFDHLPTDSTIVKLVFYPAFIFSALYF
jgi:hypothetical protein